MNVKKEKRFKVGGKQRLIKFGTNATSIFCDIRNLSLVEAQAITAGAIKPGEMRDVIYSALAAGEIKANPDVNDIGQIDFTKWDVGDWIDEMPDETLQKIHNFMNEVDTKKKPVKEDT